MGTTLFWIIFLGTIAIIGLIHVLHGVFVDRYIVYVKEEFTSPKISKELDGYRIAFVTDTHGIREKKLQGAVERIQSEKIDLLLLGGDFSVKAEKTARDLALLATIDTTDGIYGVQGNHDYKNQLFQAMRKKGMIPLGNEGVSIRAGFYLAGSEDFRIGQPNLSQSLAEAKKEDFILLLSHNPDVSMLEKGECVDLTLSGHIHGGEASFFGLWAPLVPFESNHGWRFKGGWCKSSFDKPVYVSNGVGNHSPIRIFCPPQVIYLTLRTEEQAGLGKERNEN